MKTPPIAATTALLFVLLPAGQARASLILLSDVRSVSVSGGAAGVSYSQTQNLTTPFTTFSGNVSGSVGAWPSSYANSQANQYSIVTPDQISISADLRDESWFSWADFPALATGTASSIFTVSFTVTEPLNFDLFVNREGWWTIGGMDFLLEGPGIILSSCSSPFQLLGTYGSLSSSDSQLGAPSSTDFGGIFLPGVYDLRLNASIASLSDFLGDEGSLHYDVTLTVSPVPDTGLTALFLGMALVGLAALRRRIAISRP